MLGMTRSQRNDKLVLTNGGGNRAAGSNFVVTNEAIGGFGSPLGSVVLVPLVSRLKLEVLPFEERHQVIFGIDVCWIVAVCVR